jgi:hypothetical protein
MSILDRAEDWFIRRTLQPVYNVGQTIEPPSDDGMSALLLYVCFLLGIAVTCGHYCAR